MKKNTSKLTLLVNSCDKYADVIEVFFDILRRKWADCPYKIVLNTETYEYKDNDFDISCPCGGGEWSDRTLISLNCIETDYVFFCWMISFYKRLSINRLSNNSYQRLVK